MKCVVVGNSPSVHNTGATIDKHRIVIRSGVPKLKGNEIDLGTKTDILITRSRKYELLSQEYLNSFPHQEVYVFDDNLQYDPEKIYILYKNLKGMCINKDMFDEIKTLTGLKLHEKPTLGLISVHLAFKISDSVSICGIETKYQSNYISRGHYGDPGYLRVNDRHCIYKEMLYYNRLIRSGRLTVL